MSQTPPDLYSSPEAYQWLLERMLHAMPQPLTNTPEALQERDRAAVAEVAAFAPANANEVMLGTHCVLADAHARRCLELACEHAIDLNLLRRYNRMAASMARTSRATHKMLQRVQAARQKRHPGTAAGSAPRSRRRKSSGPSP